MKQRVHLVTLGVESVDASALFYDALGWTRADDGTSGIAAYNLYGATLALFPRADLAAEIGIDLPPGPGAQTLVCNVRDRDEIGTTIAQATSAGATVLRQPFDTDWGGRSSYFADPDGHIWECAWNPFSELGPDGQFQWGGV